MPLRRTGTRGYGFRSIVDVDVRLRRQTLWWTCRARPTLYASAYRSVRAEDACQRPGSGRRWTEHARRSFSGPGLERHRGSGCRHRRGRRVSSGGRECLRGQTAQGIYRRGAAVTPEILDMPDVTELLESLHRRRRPDTSDQGPRWRLQRSFRGRGQRPLATAERCWQDEPGARLFEGEFRVVTCIAFQARAGTQGRR